MGKLVILIPCAGQGKRMGGPINKPFLSVNGRPLLSYTLDVFQAHPEVLDIRLIVHEGEVAYTQQVIVEKGRYSKVQKLIVGGKERQDSVYQGLLSLGSEVEWVAIHDGVRPLLSAEVLTQALQTAFTKGSAVVGVPSKDTIKVVDSRMQVVETPERQTLWQIQTPQVFRREILLRAYQQAYRNGYQGTDDASLVEQIGQPVFIVRGEYSNIKITTPEDLVFLESVLKVGKT